MFFSSLPLLTTARTSRVSESLTFFRQDSTNKSDSISVADLKSLMKTNSQVQVIDARMTKDFDRTRVIPGARRGDPTQVAQWAGSLDKTKPVVIYCVHGHRVSQQVVDHLRQSGFSAQKLTGGIEAWKQLKGATTILE
ncbi:thiosulfate sulfurtransferase GlpE [Dyadobacter linearis]|nr:thiosulfate sulfurtransferase GlpE [Dyadobacter sp. CECT 9623]